MTISIVYIAFPQHGHWSSYTACLIVTILHTDLFLTKFHIYLLISPKMVVAVPSDSVAIGNPSGMCAKLRTVVASNNRDHAPQSLLLLLARATYIMVLFFTHIPFVVNHTINATPPERLQQHPLLFTTNHTDRTLFV